MKERRQPSLDQQSEQAIATAGAASIVQTESTTYCGTTSRTRKSTTRRRRRRGSASSTRTPTVSHGRYRSGRWTRQLWSRLRSSFR